LFVVDDGSKDSTATIIAEFRDPRIRYLRNDQDVLFDADLTCLEDADYSMRLALRGPLDFVSEPLVKIYRNYEGPHVWNPEAPIQGYPKRFRGVEARNSTRRPCPS
jgi:glycosyltransferase involved in cell wall biosynthesis